MRDKFYEFIPLKSSRPWLALSLILSIISFSFFRKIS